MDSRWEPQVGDDSQADGADGVVRKIETVERNEVVYDLAVADAHTFFVADADGWSTTRVWKT